MKTDNEYGLTQDEIDAINALIESKLKTGVSRYSISFDEYRLICESVLSGKPYYFGARQ